MSEYNSIRMVSKLFKCTSCLKKFKNLVHIQETISKCPNCGNDICCEIINSEFNKETINKNQNNPDLNSSSQSNNSSQSYNYDNNSYFRNNNNSGYLEDNFFFIATPSFSNNSSDNNLGFVIYGRSERNNENSLNEDMTFGLDIYTLLNYILYRRIATMNIMMDIQNNRNPPVEQNIIDKLKHFKMSKAYCKKSEKENLVEFPKCTICLNEITEDMEVILLPCEHIFHSKCITLWLKIHNTCPLCRFELPNNIKDFELYQRNHQNDYNLNQFNNSQNIGIFEDVD